MKLRNKKTGEIGYLQNDTLIKRLRVVNVNNDTVVEYSTLAELNEEWEDVPEEPKGMKDVYVSSFCKNGVMIEFETLEEAEKAVECLRAWKRLKDKGFRFEGIKQDYTRFNQQEPMRTGRRYLQFNKAEDDYWMKENWEDLDLLFGDKK